jgi:hypothetical protein
VAVYVPYVQACTHTGASTTSWCELQCVQSMHDVHPRSMWTRYAPEVQGRMYRAPTICVAIAVQAHLTDWLPLLALLLLLCRPPEPDDRKPPAWPQPS